MTHPTGDPLIGRTVAHYEIVSRLGGGGMGVVYRAHDRKLGRTVAVKFLPPQWSHDEAAKQRFIREAQAASATHHPAICTIHDIETADDGQLFIVMAYYEGPTLKERLQHGPLPVDEALDLATQLADGLAKAHAQGVVHRDIKPGNLILTDDGVRIVDFGLATFADALQLTTDGSTLGTAAYMSPEQSRGEDADARTDVWAAGVVLYEMLAGHVPFRGSHAEAIAYAVRNDQAPALRPIRPEIPEEVEQLVFRALHKEAAIRFQSGRELARALRQVRGLTVPQDLRTQIVQMPPPAEGIRARPAVSRRRIAALVAAAALLGGAPALLLLPVERPRVAVAPVVNETGYPQLDSYGYALAEELAAALETSSFVDPVRPGRIREILRPFRAAGRVGTSGVPAPVMTRDAALAIHRHSGAAIVLAPRLAAAGDQFRLQLDVVDPSSGSKTATLQTAGDASSLLEATAYGLVAGAAPVLDQHVAAQSGWRASLGLRLRRLLARAPGRRFDSLAAAAAFERGLDAQEQLEYASALAAFTEAADADRDHPLPHAWRSRMLLLMRRDADAADAARRAGGLALDSLAPADRRFVAAVTAEARGDFEGAGRAYAEMVEGDPDDAWLHLEQAAFLERRGAFPAAIGSALRAVEAGGGRHPGRAELELCRLYGPSRGNDVAQAREHGDRAMAHFRALRWPAETPHVLEAQVSMCRVDYLRDGLLQNRAAATAEAAAAMAILGTGATPYQHARALYYRGLADMGERRGLDAVARNREALEAARQTTNRGLEALVRLNLGAAHATLGNRREAVGHYTASADLFRALGEEQRAADAHVNAAGILIEFGDDPALGFRLVENALRVTERRGSSRALVIALQVSAAYLRNTGRHTEADQRLNRAITVAQEQKFEQRLPSLVDDRARSMIELGEHATARTLVSGLMTQMSPAERLPFDIRLAQIDTLAGDLVSARARLEQAAAVAAGPTSTILLETALGEVEFAAGRLGAARPHFARAAALWGADLPHFRAVESLAYLGLLDGLAGRPGGGDAVRKALAQAERMGRLGLATRCRVFLARLALAAGRRDEARRILGDVPADADGRTIGPELRAQVDQLGKQAFGSGAPDVNPDRPQGERR